MPRVSVIMPALNASMTVERAIRSVLDQSWTDAEIVLADDGSTDDTAEIARRLGARVVRTQGRTGPAAARNAALRASDSELVAFLDADDEWLPTYLARQIARFDAEQARGGAAVGIVACDAYFRTPDGETATTFLGTIRPPVDHITLEEVLRRNCVYISALVPREAGDEVGWFAEDLFGTEDHDLWIRILETRRRAVLIREPLAIYSLSEGSVSSNIARQGANNQLTYIRALSRGRLMPPERRIAKRALRYNRAMEGIARARFEGDIWSAVRIAPTALRVAATERGYWSGWARALLHGDPRAS